MKNGIFNINKQVTTIYYGNNIKYYKFKAI